MLLISLVKPLINLLKSLDSDCKFINALSELACVNDSSTTPVKLKDFLFLPSKSELLKSITSNKTHTNKTPPILIHWGGENVVKSYR